VLDFIIELGKKCFNELQRPKKAKIRLGMRRILHFYYVKIGKKFRRSSKKPACTATYSFCHKFSFSKIWSSLDFAERHKTS
jgi:hypothetical protein